jgi:hypothetical protein
MADATAPGAGEQDGTARVEAADGRRNAWILTGYGIFGLAMLALIAYTVAPRSRSGWYGPLAQAGGGVWPRGTRGALHCW